MTASKLEESILARAIAELANLIGYPSKNPDKFNEATVALRAFAEAVRECNCACNKKQEPKESKGCAEFCDCKPPAALPDEVKETIKGLGFLRSKCT